MRHFANPARGTPPSDVLTPAGFAAARAEIEAWPGYAPTKLRRLDRLAAALGVGALLYKDEGGRFGLGSFKALGGAYAVGRIAARHKGELLTVTTATDGNHGRSVAWGARLYGARAVIFVPAQVSAGRRAAIARYGADVVEVKGNYDDAVRHCAAEAERQGWTIVSDTSWDGYTEIPRDVMYGYGIIADEVAAALGEEVPTHAFLHAGVGALAGSLMARFVQLWGAHAPRFVIVEPEKAACCFESAAAGRPTPVGGDLDTMMAGLSAGEVSRLGWPIVARAGDFLAIEDDWAPRAMRLLADAHVVAGETGAAGVAALLALREAPHAGAALGLGPAARVLVIGSEGDTDPDIYRRLVGRSGDEVRQP